MNLLDNYGLYNGPTYNGELFTEQEKIDMVNRRRRDSSMDEPISYEDEYKVPSLDELLESTAAMSAPTGINPAAPASSQPPAVTNPVGSIAPTVISTTMPNTYERKEGVTLNDRLQSLAITMSAVGTPQFADAYATANQMLAVKQSQADSYNMALDEGTQPTLEVLTDGTTVKRAPKYIRNPDNTYSINPKSGSVLSRQSSIPGLESLTKEQQAAVLQATGDNKDTMAGYFLGQNAGIVPLDMPYDQYVVSTLNANQGETSKSFNRNTGIFQDKGFTKSEADSLAMLAENGGLEIVKNADTGEIKAINPVTKESFVIEDYQTGLQKIVEAAGSTQDAKNRSDLDKEQVTTITTRLNDYDAKLGQIDKSDEVSSYWVNELEAKDANGNYIIDYEKDFGWLNSLMSDYFGVASPEFSGLSADAIYEALQNLEITNLAPVSNFEFKQVMNLFANGKLATREQAIAVLKRAQARAERERGETRNRFDNDLDSLKRLQSDQGPEYLNYSGKKSWMTDDEARNKYRRPKQ